MSASFFRVRWTFVGFFLVSVLRLLTASVAHSGIANGRTQITYESKILACDCYNNIKRDKQQKCHAYIIASTAAIPPRDTAKVTRMHATHP